MIPAEFDYAAPSSIEEVFTALSSGGEDAKILAGGHSLIPLMKLRLAAPTLLVDIRRVPGLSGVQKNGDWSVGAMTPHATVQVTVNTAQQEEGQHAVVTVGDQGPGIDPELMPRLFTRFGRGPESSRVRARFRCNAADGFL